MFKLNDIYGQSPHLQKVYQQRSISIKIQKHWDSVFGSLAKDLFFGFLKGRTLFMQSKNPLWVTEIDYHKPMLIERLNQLFDNEKVVADIRIRFFEKPAEKKKAPKKTQLMPKNLEGRVRFEHARRLKEGYILCTSCQKMLAKGRTCIFCRLARI